MATANDFINTMLQVETIKRQRNQDALAAQVTRQEQLNNGYKMLANAPVEARPTLINLLSSQGVASVSELSAAASSIPESSDVIKAKMLDAGVSGGSVDPNTYAMMALLGQTPGAMARDEAIASMPKSDLGQATRIGMQLEASPLQERQQRFTEANAAIGNQLQAQSLQQNMTIASAQNRLQYASLAQNYGIAMAQMKSSLDEAMIRAQSAGKENAGKAFGDLIKSIDDMNTHMQAVAMPPEAQAIYRAGIAAQFKAAMPVFEANGLGDVANAALKGVLQTEDMQSDFMARKGR